MLDRPSLFGSEFEASVAVTQQEGRPGPPTEKLAQYLIDVAPERIPCLRDATMSNSLFLENGGRFYIDINGHPEYCTPECSSPEQIVLHDKAGERILLMLAEKVKDKYSIDMTIFKNNQTSILPDSASFGNHESYLCWITLAQAAESLMGHLVSRLPFAGAGCLSPNSAGMGFELSQRARHLLVAIGSSTTRDRAIFCNRVRRNSDLSEKGWIRAHLISKDSQRASLGNYLTFGTTGLIFWVLNHGGSIGINLQPSDPVQALRTISLDPWLKAKIALTDGRKLSALEIQQEYLAGCERFAAKHDLPPWGENVLRRWAEVLASLRRDPLELSTRLDTYAKLMILEHEVRRAGLTWGQVREALRLLDELRRAAPHACLIRALVAEAPNSLPTELREAYDMLLARAHAAGPQALDHVRIALRLQVLDLKYHELGGLYDRLARDGQMKDEIVSPSEIDCAVIQAPPGGRAMVRGTLVKKFQGQSEWMANWDMVVHCSGDKYFDLDDPFVAQEPQLFATQKLQGPHARLGRLRRILPV